MIYTTYIHIVRNMMITNVMMIMMMVKTTVCITIIGHFDYSFRCCFFRMFSILFKSEVLSHAEKSRPSWLECLLHIRLSRRSTRLRRAGRNNGGALSQRQWVSPTVFMYGYARQYSLVIHLFINLSVIYWSIHYYSSIYLCVCCLSNYLYLSGISLV